MASLRSTLLALAALVVAGCAELKMAPVTEYPVTAQRVILVSLDGVRADALPYLPTVLTLTQRGVWTDAMQTVLPALTLPAHLSMLSGRDVTQYGITQNAMDAGIAAVMRLNGMTTMFEWARVADMLHLHVNTVKRLGDRGELPFYRVCKRGDRRFRLDDVMKFLSQNR